MEDSNLEAKLPEAQRINISLERIGPSYWANRYIQFWIEEGENQNTRLRRFIQLVRRKGKKYANWEAKRRNHFKKEGMINCVKCCSDMKQDKNNVETIGFGSPRGTVGNKAQLE